LPASAETAASIHTTQPLTTSNKKSQDSVLSSGSIFININIKIGTCIAHSYNQTKGALHDIIQSCMCDGKVFLNSRQMQNADISCVILRQVGSWFHAHGAAMQNALSANIWFVYGAT